MASDYLPPVVIDVLGDDSDFIRVISRDQAALADFAKKTAIAHLGLDEAQFDVELAKAKVALGDLTSKMNDVELGADATDFYGQIAKIKATLDALSSDSVVVGANTTPALAKIMALRAAIDSLSGDISLSAVTTALQGPAIPVGGGGEGGLGAATLAAAAGGDKGGTGSSLWSLLGMGGGLGGLASFGSIAGTAGFGAESLATVGLGIGGSALGGLAGAGVMGTAGAGVMGVGMGSDMAVMKSTLADTKQLSTAYSNLQNAVTLYGASSTQAAAAQAQLNLLFTQLGNTAGVRAEAMLAAMANTIDGQWDAATSNARVQVVELAGQFLNLASKYIPLVANAATLNFAIINKAIKPLVTWLGTTGMKIFGDLEAQFARNLPTAVHAFSQAIELILKTMDHFAPQLGHVTQAADKLFTRLNGPGFGNFTHHLQTAVNIMHVWWGLIKNVGLAIYELFHHDAGTGTAIVAMLSKMVGQFDKWAATVKGGDQLKNLFEAHKTEILNLLALLKPMISSFGQLDLAIRPALMDIVGVLAKLANALFKIPGVGKLLALGVAGAVLYAKMKPLQNLSKIWSVFQQGTKFAGLLGQSLLKLKGGLKAALGSLKTGLTGMKAAGAEAEAGETEAAAGATLLESALGIGLILVLTLLLTHWKQVWGAIKVVAKDVYKFLDGIWHDIDKDARKVWGMIEGFFKKWWPEILIVFTGGLGLIVVGIVKNWDKIKSVTMTVFHAITSFFKTVWHDIESVFKVAWDLISMFVKIQIDVVKTAIQVGLTAIEAVWRVAWAVIKSVVQTVWNGIKVVIDVGVTAFDGIKLALGALSSIWSTIWNGIQTAVQAVWSVIKPIFDLIGHGISAITSGISGIGHVIGGVGHFLGLAGGGDFVAGQPLVVGEKGPEIMIPKAAGTVLPNAAYKAALAGGTSSPTLIQGGGSAAGAVNINAPITINGTNQSPTQIAQAVRVELLKLGRRVPNTGLGLTLQAIGG